MTISVAVLPPWSNAATRRACLPCAYRYLRRAILPATARPDADVAELAHVMVARDAHTVPIVAEDQVVGVVSRCDMLRTLMPTDEAAQREAQRRVDAYGGQRRWPVTVHDAVATISGRFDDDIERAVAEALVRTTSGVADVRVLAQVD